MASKTCVTCGEGFTPVKGNERNRSCGSCLYQKYRLQKVASRYGITAEQYMDMYAAQGGRCAICGIHESELPKRLHVDHDHACCPGVGDTRSCGKCVRGLLCAKCNTSIGQFESRPELLIAAYEYLEGGGEDR